MAASSISFDIFLEPTIWDFDEKATGKKIGKATENNIAMLEFQLSLISSNSEIDIFYEPLTLANSSASSGSSSRKRKRYAPICTWLPKVRARDSKGLKQ